MKTSWYKEPWAWLVFFLPFSAVVAGISTLIIANTDADTLVVGDYYKKGKAINLELSKIKLAQKLGMEFQLKTQDNNIIIKPTGIEKSFSLLKVKFFHPTLEEKDFELTLTPDGSGNFRQHVEQSINGKWLVTITTFNADWKLENYITLPQSEFYTLKPELENSY